MGSYGEAIYGTTMWARSSTDPSGESNTFYTCRVALQAPLNSQSASLASVLPNNPLDALFVLFWDRQDVSSEHLLRLEALVEDDLVGAKVFLLASDKSAKWAFWLAEKSAKGWSLGGAHKTPRAIPLKHASRNGHLEIDLSTVDATLLSCVHTVCVLKVDYAWARNGDAAFSTGLLDSFSLSLLALLAILFCVLILIRRNTLRIYVLHMPCFARCRQKDRSYHRT